MKNRQQGYINHIAIVVDESTSMGRFAGQVVEVADEQIKHLAQRSKDLDQETRVTVYTFSDAAPKPGQIGEPDWCVFYDKDVLRLPSLQGHYRPSGCTALVDATLLALNDLAKTPELYGDHAFLVFVLTDGEENDSNSDHGVLARRLEELPDHWTVAVLVPNQQGKHEAKRFGFPADNVAVWDPTLAHGVEEAGRTIRTATDNFMVNRASGVRGSRNLFATGVDTVNKATIRAAALKSLPASKYRLVPVPYRTPIKPFVESCNLGLYAAGIAYYELKRAATIQGNKQVVIVEKATSQAYTGPGARKLIGLTDQNVRKKPQDNPLYKIFVQSTSVNRVLEPGDSVLVML